MGSEQDNGNKAEAITQTPTNVSEAMGTLEKAQDADHDDVGLTYYRQALEIDPARLEQVAHRVRIKLDCFLLPFMCSIYLMGFLDKMTLNYANAYSLQADLNLHGRQYSWLAAILNLGFVAGSYPASFALQKLPIGKVVGVMLLFWGTTLMVSAASKNFATLLALRFLLGLFESAIGPAWVLLTSMFWTRKEQPLRMCFWLGCNGIAQLLGSGISVGIGKATNVAVKPWQLIFLVIGSITFALGLLALYILPSGPSSVKFLNDEERIVSVWRVANNQTGIKNHKFLRHQAKEAALDIRVWCLAVQQLCVGIMNGAVSNYFSAFLKGFGWTATDSVLYQLPNGAVQFVATIIAGYVTSKVKNSLLITILITTIFPIVAFVGMATISEKQVMALTSMIWIFCAFGATIILNWAVVAANFAGHTKRMCVNGVNFACYYGGNFIGPFLFIPSEAPRYHSATITLAAISGLSVVVTAILGLVMWRENRKRDAVQVLQNSVVTQEEGALDGFADYTDKENKAFRYRL